MTEKQPLTLEVEVTKPGQKSKWYFEGEEVSASARIKLSTDGAVHRLTITNAELDDEGKYKVVIGDKESEASVLVEGEFVMAGFFLSLLYLYLLI